MSDDFKTKRSFSGPNDHFNKGPFSGPSVQSDEKNQINLDLSTDMITSNKFPCGCGKSFFSKFNLKRHVIKCHPTDEHILQSLNLKVCETSKLKICDSSCNGDHISTKRQYKCPLCKGDFENELINEHFLQVHDVKLETSELKFESYESFLEWKDDLENKTKSKFIIHVSEKPNATGTVTYFRCHRSGHFHSQSSGKRHIKQLGSKKINAYCPAKIKLIKSKRDEYYAYFQGTHVGHENDMGHLFLSSKDRTFIASKIAAKVPFDAILDEIRDSISDSGLERFHLITRKDLQNIERSFDLASSAVKHSNDSVSVDMWVNEMLNSQNPCVLYYKAQGAISPTHTFLNDEDFILIIMTDAQSEMLKKFSSDCICIDGTHGMNAYGFELITLLIIDNLREGFPCAFLISNRSDQPVLSIFFSIIKQKVGTLQPKVFMSDMADSFFNAWVSEMGIPEKRLFCAWHVDRAWRRNLKKITGTEKQAQVYQVLRTLLQECDIQSFNTAAEAVLNYLKNDPDTIDFANYFSTHYLKDATTWAYCHRVHCGLNTNMHIERMHRTLKYIYLHGKNVKRLDKAVHAIMRYIRDKMFDRIITSNKGKLTSKIRDLRNRHKTSLTLSSQILQNESGWIISSVNNLDLYTIQKVSSDCNCELKCTECNVCIHTYMCTCIDSSIKWNMCKHIHYLCQMQKNSPADTVHDSCNDPSLIIDDTNDIIMNELMQSTSQTLTLAERKMALLNKFMSLINSITTPDEVTKLEKIYKSAEYAINTSIPHFEPPTVNIPANKKIVQQRSFKQTKRRKIMKNSIQTSVQNFPLTVMINNKINLQGQHSS